MKRICTSLFLLQYASTVFICCYLQNAYGDYFFIAESATCLEATINCMDHYKGQLANETHLDRYEQDTGCSTAHLAIWLWSKPYSCKFRDGTATTKSEEEQSTSYQYPSSLSSSSSTSASAALSSSNEMIIQATEETHMYICVTDDSNEATVKISGCCGKLMMVHKRVMVNKTNLCNPKEIQRPIDMEQSENYIEAILGPCVGAVAILAMLVLLILYKRRTRERPTRYWPHTSNGSEDGTKATTINSAKDSPIIKDMNDHHYTLPKTTSSCVKMVNLVRPALRKTTDVRAWSSEANLYSLPYQCSERPHAGLCFTTSVRSKTGTVSSPEIHIYETIEPCICTNHGESPCRCKNRETISKQCCHTDVDQGYIEFFATSGAASAPDLYLYEKLKPCSCIDKLGGTCTCNRYTSLRVQNNPLHDVRDDMDFRVISGSASAPNLT